MASHHFVEDFSTGNDQHPGPRPNQVEETISVLDPGPSSRGQGDCEGQVGCADRVPGFGQMGKAEGGICGAGGQIEAPLFFVDGDASSWEPFGVYIRATEAIIGDEKSYDYISPDLASRGITDFQRIHIVEDWRQQRLEWLDDFKPGEIRDSLLQDAIGSNGGDWLKNMAVWGYPKGWVGVTDPREHVRELVKKEHADGWNDEMEGPEPFVIFGDGREAETIYLNGMNCQTPSDDADSDSDLDTSSSSIQESSSDFDPNDNTPSQPIRWAHYPPTQFASHLLPIYNGTQLPPISHCGSSTYTTDRQDLWQRIISGKQSSMNDSSPWRLPTAFDTSPSANQPHTRDYNIPPPPTTEPPPLPPPPLLDGQVSLIRSVSSISVHNSSSKIPQNSALPQSDDCDGSDMDMSDS